MISQGVDSLVRKQHDQEHEAFLDWLTPVDYTSQQIDYFTLRHPGTGQWLLEREEFQAWIKTKGQILFCPGVPGAGKTTITSIIINYLQFLFSNDENTSIAYIYCNFQRKEDQKARNMLLSLLRQLAQSPSHLTDDVRSLYERHKSQKTMPSTDEIARALQSIITQKNSRVFVVVDALDECQEADGNRKQFLSDMFDLHEKCGVSLFVTSRFIPEIENAFEGYPSIHISANHNDVWSYLDAQMMELPTFVREDAELQSETKSRIGSAANGV